LFLRKLYFWQVLLARQTCQNYFLREKHL